MGINPINTQIQVSCVPQKNKRENIANFGKSHSEAIDKYINKDKPVTQDILNVQPKKLTKGQKWGIALGSVALVVTGILVTKKLNYKKALDNFTKFPERIPFKKSKTISEARQFAKLNFHVKTYDVDDLEIANYINRSLVKMNNKTKGMSIIPRNIFYNDIEKDKNVVAYVKNLNLTINKNYFNNINASLQKRIDQSLKNNNLVKKGETIKCREDALFENKYKHSLNRYLKMYQDGKLTTKTSKADLILLLTHNSSNIKFFYVDSQDKVLKALYKNGLRIEGQTIQQVLQKTPTEKTAIIFKFENYLKKNPSLKKIITSTNAIPEEFTGVEGYIFHELGHLNHFRNMHYTKYKITPAIINFFKNSEQEQKIAKRVSRYAATNPEEFIAEVIRGKTLGKNYPPEIIEMYKKYRGPKLFNAA